MLHSNDIFTSKHIGQNILVKMSTKSSTTEVYLADNEVKTMIHLNI